MWKGVFPPELLSNSSIMHGFTAGLQLMNQAMELGASAPSKLQKPNFQPLSRQDKKSDVMSGKNAGNGRPDAHHAPPADITFRTIAEEFMASNDLLLLPLHKSHSTTGKPLFRVGSTIEGKGVTIYFGEDAVFVRGDDDVYRAVGLPDLVKAAGEAK